MVAVDTKCLHSFSLQVLSNWLFFNDNLKVAITRPRIHSQLFPPTVLYEKTLPPEIVTSLTKNFGHVSITNDTYDVSGEFIRNFLKFQSEVRVRKKHRKTSDIVTISCSLKCWTSPSQKNFQIKRNPFFRDN